MKKLFLSSAICLLSLTSAAIYANTTITGPDDSIKVTGTTHPLYLGKNVFVSGNTITVTYTPAQLFPTVYLSITSSGCPEYMTVFIQSDFANIYSETLRCEQGYPVLRQTGKQKYKLSFTKQAT